MKQSFKFYLEPGPKAETFGNCLAVFMESARKYTPIIAHESGRPEKALIITQDVLCRSNGNGFVTAEASIVEIRKWKKVDFNHVAANHPALLQHIIETHNFGELEQTEFGATVHHTLPKETLSNDATNEAHDSWFNDESLYLALMARLARCHEPRFKGWVNRNCARRYDPWTFRHKRMVRYFQNFYKGSHVKTTELAEYVLNCYYQENLSRMIYRALETYQATSGDETIEYQHRTEYRLALAVIEACTAMNMPAPNAHTLPVFVGKVIRAGLALDQLDR